MPLAIGDNVAGYRILRLLGTGGMGEVYLAQHPRLPRPDALKILHPEAALDDDFRQRFIREADLAAKLTHPNIVTVHDRGEFDGQLWIASQYVDGIDAAQLLQESYPDGMPAGLASGIISAIAGALDYAHERGLVHRDVKPANILLSNPDRNGRRHAYLADFGIARSLTEANGLTATNMTVGTFAYCAPEQLLGEGVGDQADQYALAATAYHLLTGSRLYPGSNAAVVINHQINTTPPSLAEKRPELARLDPVLRVGLAKRADDRFHRCVDFAEALADHIDTPGMPGPADPTIAAPKPKVHASLNTPSAAPPALGQKVLRTRLLVATALTGAIVVGGVLLAWWPWHSGDVGRVQRSEAAVGSVTADPKPATTPNPNSKEALEIRAHRLDVFASQANAAAAYEFYSQRCKKKLGDLDRYKAFLNEWLKGRNPEYSGVTVKVNGSSAQVVSIDNDPNTPASSMDPRTWTFIDGAWQFDNC